MMRQMLGAFNGQMQAAFTKSEGEPEPELLEIRDKFLRSVPDRVMPVVSKHLPAIKMAMACAYTHKFSIEELRDIDRFAASPAGRHYFGASLSMIGDPAMATENGLYLADVKALMDTVRGELLADLSKYAERKRMRAKQSGRIDK